MKNIKIAGMEIQAPKGHAGIGRILEELQTRHEAGTLQGLFVVFADEESGSGCYLAGSTITYPYLCMAADALADAVLDDMFEDFKPGRRSGEESNDE